MRSLIWLTLSLLAVSTYLVAAWLAAGGNPIPMAVISILYIGVAMWSGRPQYPSR